MKSKLFFTLLLVVATTVYGQKKMEKGYFIDTAQKRVDCFIYVASLENLNDKGATLDYHLSDDGTSEKIPLERIIEVGLDNDVKFHRYDVEIDDSNLFQVKTSEKYPIYEKKRLFLNVLVDGKASLMSVDNGNGTKFFYRIDASPIQQLVYKKYRESDVLSPKENLTYRQQLSKEVVCAGDPFEKFASVPYERKALIKIFEQYNACNGGGSLIFKNEKKSRYKLYYGVHAGAQITSGKVSQVSPDPDDASKTNFVVGGEAELRSSNDKWGIVGKAELEMVNISMESVWDVSPFTDDIQYDTYTIESPFVNLSVNGRIHLNPDGKSRFFVDLGLGFSIPTGELEVAKRIEDQDEVFPTQTTKHTLDTSIFGATAVGCTISNHFGVEVKGNFGRTPMHEAQGIATVKVSAIGINLKYTF